MREQYFDNRIQEKEYSGLLYGLGGTYTNGETGSGRAGVTLAEPEKDTVTNSLQTGSGSGSYLNSMATPFTAMHTTYGRWFFQLIPCNWFYLTLYYLTVVTLLVLSNFIT